MYYYSVDYKTNPPNVPLDLQEELKGKDYQMGFLFGHQNKLNEIGIKAVLEFYLKKNKIDYTEIIITDTHEISEKEYKDRTQYT